MDELIKLLQKKCNFETRDSSYSPGNQHEGTLLIKSVNGDDAQMVLEGVKNQLKNIEPPSLVNFNCQLTVAGFDEATEIVFIK